MNENSLGGLIGRIALDSQGRRLGEIETISNNNLVVVRGLTTIVRALIPVSDIASRTDSVVMLVKNGDDYVWNDIGVRCENCGNYTRKPTSSIGHYFCSDNCKNQFIKKFFKASQVRT